MAQDNRAIEVPRQDQNDTITMNLQNAVTINGQRYPRGMGVKVPKAQADDIARIDYEATEQTNNLVRQPKEFSAQNGINPITGRPWSNNE